VIGDLRANRREFGLMAVEGVQEKAEEQTAAAPLDRSVERACS